MMIKMRMIKAENDLQEAILSNNLEILSTQFEESKKYKIDLHLKKEATLNEDRLKREKDIREHLDSLKVVENHKTILKQVDELDQKLKSAEDNNVQLDKNLLQRAKDEKERLLAEKELRQFLSNVTIEMASQEHLDNLTLKVDTADKCKVADEYVSKGKDLKEKFILNLDDIVTGKDTRTTVMIRNIPIKYTDQILTNALSEFNGKYDCLYMPYDYEKSFIFCYKIIFFIINYTISFF